MRLVYRHFAFLGPESLAAAEAAECANEQGAFWAYHDTIFANQAGENRGAFSETNLKAFAAQLGLDTKAFNQCLASHRYRDAVIADYQEGQQRGVRSTPTFFINGQKIEGALPFAQFQTLIEAALNE